MAEPRYPWRLDTNDRYREVIKVVMGLATGSLVVPVIFLRDVLRLPSDLPLSQALDGRAYWSWACLALSVLFGIVFHYASAKWVRLAWEQPVTFFGIKTNDNVVERVLEVSFWGTIIAFGIGIALIVSFLVTVIPKP